MGMRRGKGTGEGRERGHQMRKYCCFLGTNRPIGFAMLLAEKPEALMTNQK